MQHIYNWNEIFEGIREAEYVYKRDEFIIAIELAIFKSKLKNKPLYFSGSIRWGIDYNGEAIEYCIDKKIYDSLNETYIKLQSLK